jgi:hypothetical protein
MTGGPHPTRRELLWSLMAASAAGLGPPACAANFWDKKPPEEWSAEEIHQLLTVSPWARTVKPVRADRKGGGTQQVTRPSMPLAEDETGRSGKAAPPGSGDPLATEAADARRGTPSNERWVVLWESAEPVRLALGVPLLPSLAGLRVISVSGAEAPDANDAYRAQLGLQAVTALGTGKVGDRPVAVEHAAENGSVWYFGFSREPEPITQETKAVYFETLIGGLRAAAAFDPKQMIFQKKLAI